MQERPVFGTVRHLSAGGLQRKTDLDAHVQKVERLVAKLGRAREAERSATGAGAVVNCRS